MDKVYKHKEVENKIYKNWEEKGFFKPAVNPRGKPFSIILPPPNANAPLHFGHAMYTVEDILIRFHRMMGDKTLWLPGADHAGFETQFVFEKKLEKEGKSRFDFDQEILYKMIWDFVSENRPVMEGQLRRLGYSLDWSRGKFTLDPEIIKIVYKTFKKLYDDGLVYRAERLVNYCTYDGTSFSDLEVIYEERRDPLYYVKYGPLVLATTRPETKFGDTAVAVHPQDNRYKQYIDKEIDIETVLGKAKIKVIADKFVDPEFGTGVVKITPAHDFDDNEVASRHNLPLKQVIGFDGKLNDKAGKFEGMYVKQARKAVVEEMQKKGLIEKIDENYTHRIALCYKCKNPIEPLPLEQWFLKTKPLAKPAIEAIRKGKIKFYPKRHDKTILNFLENIKDWNISRQIVWGIRIPAWKDKKSGKWVVTEGEVPEGNFKQETDTFDTWFSSGQWPFATLQTTKERDFETFYPTSVMETMYDILLFWVARMIMLGIYITGEIPFRDVVLHGAVKDPFGKKMSKSKGNVVDPLEIVEEYGADSVRFALIYGTAFGNDQALSYPKLINSRNFANKLWNIARLIIDYKPEKYDKEFSGKDREILGKSEELIKKVTKSIENYRFHEASEAIYEFTWHEFADKYIEEAKGRREESQLALETVLGTILKLLHPFMPFITEEIYQKINPGKYLIVADWPFDSAQGKPTHEEKK
ncbi:MAG: Valyl-tRNA synthetase [Candidatus Levybacteria bacterium GW2011_GWA2_36_13]|nr:MAG: Valyl-tRNA synthetase [Candidatus Levybacteria bacterium GW2011_GWA2_36_13]